MDGKEEDNELSQWFSTYGSITAERILEKYHINLSQDLLLASIKNQTCFYYGLLQIPIKNVLNGIVLQQAHDYHVYVQKLFIDYLLSSESSSADSSPGASTRDAIEEERQLLVSLGESFHQLQTSHNNLIASSQKSLIEITKQWNAEFEVSLQFFNTTIKSEGLTNIKPSLVRQGLHLSMIEINPIDAFARLLGIQLKDSTKSLLLTKLVGLSTIADQFADQKEGFLQQTIEINGLSRSYRTQFYDTILRVTELIKLLPEYKIDQVQDHINRETLYFDKTIGDS